MNSSKLSKQNFSFFTESIELKKLGTFFYDSLTYEVTFCSQFSAAKLPKRIRNGPRMSTSPDGSSVFVTYENDIFEMKCKRGQQCTWEMLPNKLQISRRDHLQFTVPAETIPTC